MANTPAAAARPRPRRIVKRDCEHPQARHEHGTHLAYVLDRCGCPECRAAHTAYYKHTRQQAAYGRSNLVAADPVRSHLRVLSAQGIGLKQITKLTGVSGGVLTKLLYGHPRADGTRRPPSRRVSRRVAARILSVSADQRAAGALVDSTGTRRRLQALVAVGWSQAKLARQLGVEGANLGRTMASPTVRSSTAVAVADLYDQIWNQLPPTATTADKVAYSRARRQAATRGWLPPLAWDDEDLDDPTGRPAAAPAFEGDLDEVLIARIEAGHAPRVGTGNHTPEFLEAIRQLAAQGLSDSQIGRRVAMSSGAVCALRGNHGIASSIDTTQVVA